MPGSQCQRHVDRDREEPVSRRERAEVSLATSSNLLPPFQAQARVIRVDAQGEGYRLGVEFLSIA